MEFSIQRDIGKQGNRSGCVVTLVGHLQGMRRVQDQVSLNCMDWKNVSIHTGLYSSVPVYTYVCSTVTVYSA